MKSNKINYLVVGCFVLAILLGLIVSITMLTGRSGATDKYYAIYKNVTDVKFGTQVLYEGYPIGQVEKVTPIGGDTGMRFRVDFGVQKGWAIPNDSIAKIAKPGLLKSITLSVNAGNSKENFKNGDEIKGEENEDMFAAMSSTADVVTDLVHSLKPLIANVNETVKSLGVMMNGDGEVLLKELTALTLEMSQRLPQIADNVDKFTIKMNQSSDELSAFLSPQNRKKMEALLTSAGDASKNFALLSNDMNGLFKTVNSMVDKNRPDLEKSILDLRYIVNSVARHIDSVNQNMEGAARNMYEFSRQIRQNPGLLLGGTPPKDEAAGK